MAEQALSLVSPRLPHPVDLAARKRYFAPLPDLSPQTLVTSRELLYLLGRYGDETLAVLDCAVPNENVPIPTLSNLWSELRWAARTGAVEHLDDLLLRRVRLGMLLPDGASSVMQRIRSIIQPELGWDDDRWMNEEARYRTIYERAYSPAPQGF
jgi:glycerol-3-phosphate dehydrogenase